MTFFLAKCFFNKISFFLLLPVRQSKTFRLLQGKDGAGAGPGEAQDSEGKMQAYDDLEYL